MTNQRKFDYIIDEMIVMGETGHMKNLPFLKVKTVDEIEIEQQHTRHRGIHI